MPWRRSAEGRLAENILYCGNAHCARPEFRWGRVRCLMTNEVPSVARVGAAHDFYWILHAVFVKRHEHTVLFDQAFRIFFRKRGYIEKLIASMLQEVTSGVPKAPPAGRAAYSRGFIFGSQ